MILRYLTLVAPLCLCVLAKPAQAAGNTLLLDSTKLLLLVGFLLVLVLLIYLAASLLRWLHGFVQHRRACRIEAVLETKDQRFEGFLVIIGLNGCRFQPANKTTERRLLSELCSKTFSDFDVKIGKTAYPVFVDGFHSYYAPLYFYDPITRVALKTILKQSKIAPYLVAHIGHATSRRKWREDIARRRASIQALKNAQTH